MFKRQWECQASQVHKVSFRKARSQVYTEKLSVDETKQKEKKREKKRKE